MQAIRTSREVALPAATRLPRELLLTKRTIFRIRSSFCRLLSCLLLISIGTLVDSSAAQSSSVVVDVSSSQAPMRHGATGWLYGLGAPGIPSESMVAPLSPGIAAQKPPAGLQHPAGDALLVAPGYRAAGGKEMQIYIQDIYPTWPYDKLGMDDYIGKIKTVVHQVEQTGDPDFFVYVPFNEPDNNWYGYSGDTLQRFLADWKSAVLAIRSIDKRARIAGPNFEHFKPDTYRQFFTFARDNHVLPDEVTWHELHDDFFTDWYSRYSTYREIEKQLGIAPLPIVINEYAREKGDLAVPGNLVQWIARFETSGVDACLAFWTPSGTLSDLVARTWTNRPTGAWWLYQWYGQMTGKRVAVNNAGANAIGLQAIASYDETKKQARVLFGGKANDIEIKLHGFTSIPGLESKVHVSLWRIDSSGIEPTTGPELMSTENRSISAGDLTLTVTNANATSAYYAIVSPVFDEPKSQEPSYLAAYATLYGHAAPIFTGGNASVSGDGAVEFIVQVPEDGFYRLSPHYALTRGHGMAPDLAFTLNGSALKLSPDPPATPHGAASTAFLPGGINRVRIGVRPGVAIESLDLSPAHGEIVAYDAPASSASKSVDFEGITVAATGDYMLIVNYANDDHAHGGQIEDFADIIVNNAPPKRSYFKNTFGANVFRTTVIPITLNAGKNAIRFTHPQDGQLPHIARIQIAAAALTPR
jgi:hypothetical protein